MKKYPYLSSPIMDKRNKKGSIFYVKSCPPQPQKTAQLLSKDFKSRTIHQTTTVVADSFYHPESDEEDHLEISIIGIKNVIDKSVSLPRKLLWISCLSLCCSLVAYYVSSRVTYMLSKPTQVAVTLKQNDSLQLPDITICPNTPFNPKKLSERGFTEEGVLLPGTASSNRNPIDPFFNVTKLWLDLAPSIKFISGSSVNFANTMASWEVTYTTMGVCFRHRYDEDVKASGLSFGMSIRLNWAEIFYSKTLSGGNGAEGVKIFFHERRDTPLTELEGITVDPGEDLSVAIRIKQFRSLNRKDHPCVVHVEYSRSVCVSQCFEQELLQLIKCRLPFMKQDLQQHDSTSASSTPTKDCQSLAAYSEAFKTFWFHSKGNLTLWAECGRSCLIECQKLIYTPYIESVAVADGVSVGKFTIYFPEMWYEIVEQKESYDLIAFLCDVGGTFGLFLGCSVLTLVELLEILTSLFISRKVLRHTTSRVSNFN